MHAMQLQSNQDLLDVLLRLAAELEARGETQLANEIIFARRFASGSASEFLHEAHEILTIIDGPKPSILATEQTNDVKAVFTQVNETFLKLAACEPGSEVTPSFLGVG